MAEKRKGKRRKEEQFNNKDDQVEKPSKDEYAVAKWLRKNVPTKRTKFLYHNVQYFTGAKAVDALMESHWGQPKKEGDEPFFPTRFDVVEFLDMMLRHKFFHRAKKVPVSEQELLARKKKRKDKDNLSDKKETEEAESSHAEGKGEVKSDPKDGKGKMTKKIRLEMHLDQIFADGLDAYVWIYDPIPFHYWLFGTLMVLGAIAVCLFPLWPPEVRKGVYYLSIAAAGFLCFIIALAVVRIIVFCILWGLTFGKHHLWLFPNLTEDVGFFASFWPLYQYDYKGEDGSKKSRKKKDKDSDNEQDDDTRDDEEQDDNTQDERSAETNDQKTSETGQGDKNSDAERNSPSESESESSSQKSQTGKDFEMVEKEEIDGTS